MAYADVTQPVKITLSQSSVATLDNYLRRMCIVSSGGSTLTSGEYKEVNSGTFSDYAANDEIRNKLRGFFSFASSKSVILLEVGTGEITEQVDYLRSFIENGKSKSYMHLVPDAWYYPDYSYRVVDDDSVALFTSFTSATILKGESVTLKTQTNGTLSIVKSGDFDTYFTYDETSGLITANSNSSGDSTKTLTITATYDDNSTTATISLTAQTDAETSTTGETLTNYTKYRDTAFSDLASEYLGTEHNSYFLAKSDNGLVDSESWKLYDGKKSVLCVYDNLTTAYSLSSVILGIMASSHYDISSSQKATPLNNKNISGVSYDELGQTLMTELTQQPMTFTGDFAGSTVIFNGRMADGSTFEYNYQSDYMIYSVNLALSTLLLNSANNTNYVLQFNQNGIDVLNATIKGALDNLVSLGVITEYGTNFNVTTGDLENSGYVYTIDFETYRSNYSDDYENEIYRGVTFAVRIGRYIKQVNISISRN